MSGCCQDTARRAPRDRESKPQNLETWATSPQELVWSMYPSDRSMTTCRYVLPPVS